MARLPDSEPVAREAIRAKKPDFVVVDLSLERGDGIELVRQMHAENGTFGKLPT